jgi:hypothetical protein
VSAIAAPVPPRTTRESLGGQWATSFTVWALLLVPALALSAYQDIGEPYPNILIAAVACVGSCAAPALVFMIVRFLRRSTPTIPLPLCLLFWAGVGAVHGVTAGFLSWQFSGAQPHFPGQAIFWAASCLIWLPLATYAIAESAYRRRLLQSLEVEIRRENIIRRSSLLELADLRSLIVGAMQENIRPVLVEIATSLATIGPALDSARLAALGRQLSDVSEETARIIQTTASVQPAAPQPGNREIASPVGAALDFDRSRPIVAALLSSVALLPLIVAISFRSATIDSGGLETEGYILAIVTVFLGVGLAAHRFARQFQRRGRIGLAIATYGATGIAAAAIAIAGPWRPANHQNLVLALLLLVAVPLVAATLSAAVGLGNANIVTARQISDVDDEIAKFEIELERDRSEIREQVSAVTHGPLRGRLSACAMALNFHAAEIGTRDPARTEYIVTSVREHLAEVLNEMDSLG